MGIIWIEYGDFSPVYLFSRVVYQREHLMRMEHETLIVSLTPNGSGEGNANENPSAMEIPQELDLSTLEHYPVEVVEDQKTRALLVRIKNHPVTRKAAVLGAGALGLAATVSPVAADSMNWTVITEMIDGVSGLMPSVASLVMAVVPVIILLVIVGFLTGLLDGIVDAVKSGMSMMKK